MPTSDSQDRKDRKDIVKGAAASSSGLLIQVAVRALFVVLAGRLFGVEAFGKLGEAAAVVEILGGLGAMGLKRALFPLFTEDEQGGRPTDPSMAHAVVAALLWSGFLATFLMAVAWPLLGLPPALSWFAFVVPLIVTAEIFVAATRHKRIMRYQVLARNIAEPWTLVLVAGGLYFLGERGPAPLLIAYFAALAAAASVALIGYSRHYSMARLVTSRLSLDGFRRVIGRAAPVSLVDAADLMYRRIDILILGAFTGPEITGLYFMAQQVATIVQKIRFVFDSIVPPVVSRVLAEKRDRDAGAQLRQVGRWIFTLQIMLTLAIALHAEQLLWLFGPAFTAGAVILAVLCLAESVDGTFAMADIPVVVRRPRLTPLIAFIGIGAEAIAVTPLAAGLGGLGAALGFLAAMIILAITRIIIARRLFGLRLLGPGYLKPLAAAAGTALVFLWVHETLWQPVAALAVMSSLGLTLLLYIVLLSLFRFTEEDRQLFRQLRGKI